MFSDDNVDLSDEAILRAVKRRLMDELSQRQAGVVNNVYGGSGQGVGSGGYGGLVQDMAQGGEDPFNYFVDITREDLPDINPATKKPIGWTKKVERYRKRKDELEDEPKKKGHRAGPSRDPWM
jgi:hypothetical protein